MLFWNHKQLNFSPEGGVVGLPEVLEGVQLDLSHCTSRLLLYPTIIPKKNVLHQHGGVFFFFFCRYFIKRTARTATPVYLPQAQFPTEGPESRAEVWDPTAGFLADPPPPELNWL